MPAPSLTYTLTNGSTADATQVMQDLNDLLNGITDGTKDLSISALTCAGTATLNGHVNLGNSSADDLTITASLASTLPIKTNTSYDIGGATLGLRKLYLGNGGAGATCSIVSASHGTTREYTVPDCSAAASFVMTEAAQTLSGVKTFSSGFKVPLFLAVRSGTQSINNSSSTKIQFNSEVLDSHSYYDAATNHRFTPLVAGVYRVTVMASMDNLAVDKVVQVGISKNGSVVYENTYYTATGGVTISYETTALVSMNGSTDYLEGYITQGDTTARNLTAASRFMAEFVGTAS
jgi:hypothetical protein